MKSPRQTNILLSCLLHEAVIAMSQNLGVLSVFVSLFTYDLCVQYMIYVYSVWFMCTVLYNDHELLWSIKRLLSYYEQLTCVLHGLDNYHYTPKLWIVYCLCWIIYKYISLTVFSEIKVMIMKLNFFFCGYLELSPLQSYACTVVKSVNLPNSWICLKYQEVDQSTLFIQFTIHVMGQNRQLSCQQNS